MTRPTTTRRWRLNRQVVGTPVVDGPNADFTLETVDLPPLKDNQILVQAKYLSNDPAQRGWISPTNAPDRLYLPPVNAGETMRAVGLGEVIESKAPSVPVGSLVNTLSLGWAEHTILDAGAVQVVQPLPGIALTHYLGALGGPGLTAYYGTKIVGETKPDDVFVVSGAAGATGSMCVQIAKKLLGCKTVIGIAGSESKCEYVKSLGADICLNYKSPTFKQDLIDATPKYVDVYFDNVGGEILDFMLTRMALHGRVAVCGAIAQYNSTEGLQLKNWFEVISMRVQLRGLIVLDFFATGKHRDSVAEMAKAAQEGKIKIDDESETVVQTQFEDIPKTWMRLFEGANTGKLVTKL